MMRQRAISLAVLSTAFAVALLGTACRTRDLAFRTDDRVEIVRPTHREHVTVPVAVKWTADSTTVTPRTEPGRYAIFLDRAPMPPGKNLRWLGRDDEGCRRDPACPTEPWLNARGVYTASGESVIIPVVPAASDGRKRSDHAHRLIVVLLDGHGRRSGERAYSREFFLREEQA